MAKNIYNKERTEEVPIQEMATDNVAEDAKVEPMPWPVRFWKGHKDEFIFGIQTVVGLAATGLLIHHAVTGKRHNKEVERLFGPNVFEGGTIGTTGKKLWRMHSEWEKTESKNNFDALRAAVKGLNLAKGEWYMIGSTENPRTKQIMKDLIQFNDSGFWHQELM